MSSPLLITHKHTQGLQAVLRLGVGRQVGRLQPVLAVWLHLKLAPEDILMSQQRSASADHTRPFNTNGIAADTFGYFSYFGPLSLVCHHQTP